MKYYNANYALQRASTFKIESHVKIYFSLLANNSFERFETSFAYLIIGHKKK